MVPVIGGSEVIEYEPEGEDCTADFDGEATLVVDEATFVSAVEVELFEGNPSPILQRAGEVGVGCLPVTFSVN